MSWDEDAACKGASTEVFFPETSATGPRREALRFCRACPVRRECLTAALEVPADIDYGVFGGLGVMARRRLRLSDGFDPSMEVLPPVELTCVEGDCNGEAVEGRYCRGHANARLRARRAAKRRIKGTCMTHNCREQAHRDGLCRVHYSQSVAEQYA